MEKGFTEKRTVLLSPYSDMVKETYPVFWEILKKDLEKRGYTVFLIDIREGKEYKIEKEGITFPWEMSMALVEMAGYYIGVKSSLSSIVSEINCNKIILYPPEMKKFDGNIEDMSVRGYGLDGFNLPYDSVELIVPFLRSNDNFDAENEDFDTRIEEERKLIDEILSRFKDLKISKVSRNA